MSLSIMRKTIEAVAKTRGISLSLMDIEALAKAVAEAETWWDDDQLALHLPQRTSEASRRDWCFKYGVERVMMANAKKVRLALRKMPGRGHGRSEAITWAEQRPE